MYNFRFLLKCNEIVSLLHGVLSVSIENMLILSKDTLKCLILMVLNPEHGHLSEIFRFFLKWYEIIKHSQ